MSISRQEPIITKSSSRIEVPTSQWSAFQVQNYCKTEFDVQISRALRTLQQRDVRRSNVPQQPAPPRPQQSLDTLQICNKLIQWCVEGAQEIPELFKPPQSSNSHSSPYALDSVESKNDLCKFVQLHAEHIAEFRGLVAHDLLSVTHNECSSVLVSLRSLLSCLKCSYQAKEESRVSQYITLAEISTRIVSLLEVPTTETSSEDLEGARTEESFEDLSHAESTLERCVVPLDAAEGKLFIAMELLVALESTLVSLFRSVSRLLPVEVRSVSSLCALLRNECWHKVITDVTGSDPKPLTLKVLTVLENDITDLRTATGARRRRSKLCSHLDVVYLARNSVNHASFSGVSRESVVQWLQSTIAMIQCFNLAKRDFTDVITRLSSLKATLLGASLMLTVVLLPDKDSEPRVVKNDVALLPSPKRTRPTAGKMVVRMMKRGPCRSFVGREDILQRLEQIAFAIDPEPRIVILTGHPGIGKSYVALKASQNLSSSSFFQMHFWITATTNELLLAGLVSFINASDTLLADFSMPLQKVLNLALEVCRQYSCYLVFDDVTLATVSAVKEIMSSFDVQGMAVITSCIQSLDISPVAERIDVGALSIDESFKLLELIIEGAYLPLPMTLSAREARKSLWAEVVSGREVIENIVGSALGRSPLGVTLLGRLFVNEMDFEAVTKMFEGLHDLASVTSKHRPVFAQRHSGLETTVRYLLNPIRQNKTLLSLLYAMSIMSPNGIPLRLLTNFGEESKEPQSFLSEELFLLEGVGLVHSSSSPSTGTLYVMMHQLTQFALRQILPRDFGVVPLEVCQSIVQGFRRDLDLDHFCWLRVGRGLKSPEEAFKWADCVLFSSLAKLILQLSKEAKTPSELQATSGLADSILLSSHLLVDLYPLHAKRIYRRMATLVQYGEESRPCILGDIILRLQEDHLSSQQPGESETGLELGKEGFETILALCQEQRLSLEFASYFFYALLLTADRPRLIIPLELAFQALIEATNGAICRPDLVNITQGLLKCGIGFVMSTWEGRSSEALSLLLKQIKILDPGKKYYKSAQFNCRFFTAFALDDLGRYQEALAVSAPLIDECYAVGSLMPWSNPTSLTADILRAMGRGREALTLFLRALDDAQRFHSAEGMNQQLIAAAHYRLSRCYGDLREFEAAQYHFRAFETIRAKLDHRGGPRAMWSVCFLYWRWGRYSLAFEWAKRRWREVGGYAHGLVGFVMSHALFPLFAYALGPQRAAKEISKLCLAQQHKTVKQSVEKCQSIRKLVVLVFIVQSRANSWQGNHREAWLDIFEGLEGKNRLEHNAQSAVDAAVSWEYCVQFLSAGIQALRYGRGCQRERSITSLFELSSDTKQELIEKLFQKHWNECRQRAREALPLTDMGWHYEYARILLWVLADNQLQALLSSPTSVNQSLSVMKIPEEPQEGDSVEWNASLLREEALNVLKRIISANVEETEWTELSRNLLAEHQQEKNQSLLGP